MKSRMVAFVLCILASIFIFEGHSGEKTKKLQLLNRQIGNSLIQVKKKYPESQTLVYSLLDQLGKYYEFAKELVTKKSKYKQLLQAELAHTELLKKDVDQASEKMEKMKKAILSVHKKMKKDSEKAAQLEQERDQFLQEKEHFEMEREKFVFERDALLRERDALVRERDALAQEKELEQKNEPKQVQKNPVYAKSSSHSLKPPCVNSVTV